MCIHTMGLSSFYILNTQFAFLFYVIFDSFKKKNIKLQEKIINCLCEGREKP